MEVNQTLAAWGILILHMHLQAEEDANWYHILSSTLEEKKMWQKLKVKFQKWSWSVVAPQAMSRILKKTDNLRTTSSSSNQAELPNSTMQDNIWPIIIPLRVWNSLPWEIKSQTELERFTVKVKHWPKQQNKRETLKSITQLHLPVKSIEQICS